MVNRIFAMGIATLLITGVWVAEARAVEARPTTNSKSLADTGKKATPKTPIPLDRDSEAKALQLVEAHLPHIGGMLKRLRNNQPRQYELAIRDLAKSARKLESAKNRDERLFEIEVDLLKAQNEVNLLTAKLKVRDNESDRKKLRASADRLHQTQIVRADYDVEMYRARLERAKQQLEAATQRLDTRRSNTDEQIEKSYLGMLRKAGREPKKK